MDGRQPRGRGGRGPGQPALDENNEILPALVQARQAGDPNFVPKEQVTLMDISPSQIVSISAALIPFLEHDDANRALMGSNMQRQAVPLLKCDVPLVGTGMEGVVARDSGACILARGDGVVHFADAERLIVNYDESVAPNTGGARRECKVGHPWTNHPAGGMVCRCHVRPPVRSSAAAPGSAPPSPPRSPPPCPAPTAPESCTRRSAAS